MPAVVSRTVGSLCGMRLDDGWRWLPRSCQNLINVSRISSLLRGGMRVSEWMLRERLREQRQLALASEGARPAQGGAAVLSGFDWYVAETMAAQDATDGLQGVPG